MKKVLLPAVIALTTALGLLPAGPRAASSAKVPAQKEAAPAEFVTPASSDDSASGLAYARFGGGATLYALFQSKPSAACKNWLRRRGIAMQMALRAARSGSVDQIYYWNGQVEKLNAEHNRKHYCATGTSSARGSSGSSGGMCDRARYNDCVADARRRTAPTPGGMTSAGISMMGQCQQWISGCR